MKRTHARDAGHRRAATQLLSLLKLSVNDIPAHRQNLAVSRTSLQSHSSQLLDQKKQDQTRSVITQDALFNHVPRGPRHLSLQLLCGGHALLQRHLERRQYDQRPLMGRLQQQRWPEPRRHRLQGRQLAAYRSRSRHMDCRLHVSRQRQVRHCL